MRSYSWVSAVCQVSHEIVVLAARCVSGAWYYWALLYVCQVPLGIVLFRECCVPGVAWFDDGVCPMPHGGRILACMVCVRCRMGS